MKKVLVSMLAAVFVMLIFGFSSAQMSGNPPQGQKEITPEKFSELKADILKRIDDRMKRMTEEKKCVTAATNGDELRKCRPQRPSMQGGQKEQGRQGGGQFPPMGQPR